MNRIHVNHLRSLEVRPVVPVVLRTKLQLRWVELPVFHIDKPLPILTAVHASLLIQHFA